MELSIAFLQLLPEGSLQENLNKGVAACREAKERGADIALFPEMWSTGYRFPHDMKALHELQRKARLSEDFRRLLLSWIWQLQSLFWKNTNQSQEIQSVFLTDMESLSIAIQRFISVISERRMTKAFWMPEKYF